MEDEKKREQDLEKHAHELEDKEKKQLDHEHELEQHAHELEEKTMHMQQEQEKKDHEK